MEKHDPTPKQRRVGTFTLGLVLIAAGILMALSMFLPTLNLRWALKASPVILIALGIETLLSARGDKPVRYDWVGMLLCFLLVCAALCLYTVAWWLLYGCELSGFYGI